MTLSGLTLVESDTTVGDTVVEEGTFLLGKAGDKKIYHFTADGVGKGTTSGTTSTLIDGADIGFSTNVAGLELIERTITIGDTTLQPGQILVTLDGDDPSVVQGCGERSPTHCRPDSKR